MSARSLARKLHNAQATIVDPGSAGTITVNKGNAICNIVTAGAEARTLARPTRAGVIFTMHGQTLDGACTITPTGGFNEAGTSTIVLTNAGETVTLISKYDGTNYGWRVVSRGGLAALTTALDTISITDAAGTPDYALSALTTSTPYGLATQQEAISLLYVIQNLQTRVAEIEAILKAAGLSQ